MSPVYASIITSQYTVMDARLRGCAINSTKEVNIFICGIRATQHLDRAMIFELLRLLAEIPLKFIQFYVKHCKCFGENLSFLLFAKIYTTM